MGDGPPLSRNRDFQLLWSGQLVSTFGSWLSALALPLLVLDTSGAPFDAGLVRFAGTLPALLFYLPAGVTADRLDRRRLMIVTETARLLATASLAVALLLGVVSIPHVILVSLVVGAGAAFFQVAELAAIPRIVPAPQRRSALAQNLARFYAGLIGGQAAGGVLYAIGRAVPFVVDTATYVVSLATVTFIRTPLQEHAPGSRAVPLREGLAWLWRNDLLRTTVLIAAGATFVVNSLYLALIVYARQIGATSSEIGVMVASVGVFGLAGAAVADRLAKTLTFRQTVLAALGAKAILIPTVLVMPNAYAIAVPFGAMFFIDATFTAVVGARQLSLIPDRLQGRVNGAIQLISLSAVPAGALAVGFTLEAWGAVATVVGLAAIMAATTLAALFSGTIAAASRVGPAEAPATY